MLIVFDAFVVAVVVAPAAVTWRAAGEPASVMMSALVHARVVAASLKTVLLKTSLSLTLADAFLLVTLYYYCCC